jgi:hypothetical protein
VVFPTPPFCWPTVMIIGLSGLLDVREFTRLRDKRRRIEPGLYCFRDVSASVA